MDMTIRHRKFIEWKMHSIHKMPYEDYGRCLEWVERGCDNCKCYNPKGNPTGYMPNYGTKCKCNWWGFNETTIKTFLHKLELLKEINNL